MRRKQHPQSEGHDPSQNLFTGPVEIVRLGTLTGGTKAQKDRNCCLYCESSESGSLSPGVVSCFLRSRQPAVRTHGAGFPVPHYRGTIFCILLLRGQLFPVKIKNCIFILFYPFLSFIFWRVSLEKMRKCFPSYKNSPGFCPVACQIISIEFCYQPFPFFRILFETFAIEANSISNCFRNFCNRIEANSSSHFDSISNSNQLKLGHKFEPQLELELKSNTNSNHNSNSSWNRIELNRAEIESNWILFEKCAREAVAFIKE